MDQTDYIKRDVSWLSFNHRVLQEAKDTRVPLYERIKFLAIYSNNLDEFFRVRVASLRSFKKINKETRKQITTIQPKKELKQIRKIVEQQQQEFGEIFRNGILPQLQKYGIFLINEQEYTSEHHEFAHNYFEENVRSTISPSVFSPEEDLPFLDNRGLYFIVQFSDGPDLGLLGLPTDQLDRFITFPGDGPNYYITFLDDIIRFNLENLFNRKVAQAFSIKISRDAELYIDDEYSGDLLDKIKKSLDDRNIGLPTRFLYDSQMPESLLEHLKDHLDLTKNDLIPGARYHNFNDFFGFPDPLKSTELHDIDLPPQIHPELEQKESLIQAIAEKDYMLHFPYQKYDYVAKLIWEAAEDPQVTSMKITLYRVASKSAVVQALLHALSLGKKVTAFIEAKARFDEASNLYWGDQLQKANAKVLYSYPGIKVHTKLLLITREEEGQAKNYAYLGTGNFNEKTAKLYCDHALLSSDARLSDEVVQVFDLLERKIIIPKCNNLFVSPFTLRQGFETLINREIEHASNGKDAYMVLKMNSLEDPQMVQRLYQASQAGVKIKMIVRGICSLVPGIPGLSENIEVISIVDRFLEHARVYIFGNGGKEIMYTASADWMTRNLDRRVEVAIPIYQKDVYDELRSIINIQLQDNTKARKINETQSNPYRHAMQDEENIRAQIAIYELLKNKG